MTHATVPLLQVRQNPRVTLHSPRPVLVAHSKNTMRIRTLTLLVILAGASAGCGSVRNVPTDSQASIEASRVNRATRGKLARVHLRNGERVYGVGIRVTPDSTSWIEPQSNRYVSVGTDEVNRVSLTRAGQGALVGLGTGIVVGVSSGIVRAQQEGNDPINQTFSHTANEKMTIYSLAHSAYASLVTTAIGAIIGRKNTYRLVRD